VRSRPVRGAWIETNFRHNDLIFFLVAPCAGRVHMICVALRAIGYPSLADAGTQFAHEGGNDQITWERIHDRMPVILSPADYTRWLDPGDPMSMTQGLFA
jgi:hypothetical protein